MAQDLIAHTLDKMLKSLPVAQCAVVERRADELIGDGLSLRDPRKTPI